MRTLACSFVALSIIAVACSSPEAKPPTTVETKDSAAPPVEAGAPCGSAGAAKCEIGEQCTSDAMCASANCASQRCAKASCSNGKRDGDEVGKDCGGSCAERCDGAACTQASECQSKLCSGNICAPSGTKICGVGTATLCANGQECSQSADCSEDFCSSNGLCEVAPAFAHNDGVRNAGETGVDCGGTVASTKPCGAGQACKQSDDCEGLCAGSICAAPTASDGKKNQGETDVDCGGANAPGCANGARCTDDTDCERRYCLSGTLVCSTPTSSDGVKNGNETAVDCGGPGVSANGFSYMPPRCAVEKACKADSDCAVGSCSPKGLCLPPSCATSETAGIDTCGAGETSSSSPYAPAAGHETCCRSLKLPTRAKMLDKYEITAGRYRTFINAVGPNVRAWVSAYAAAKPTSQLGAMWASYPSLRDLYPADLTSAMNLRAHLSVDIDNYNGIRGCYNSAGGAGHNTYWQSDSELAQYGVPHRPLPRELTDAKSLNCQMPIMFMAFCAWDGGEMPLLADYQDAWGAGYPAGFYTKTVTGSPVTVPPRASDRSKYNWCNGTPGTGGWDCQDSSLGNNGIFYQFPEGTSLINDQSPMIAGPGRFLGDMTTLTSSTGAQRWADIYANLAEYTGDLTGSSTFCDFSVGVPGGAATCQRRVNPTSTTDTSMKTGRLVSNVPKAGIIGYSWEGHPYQRGNTNAFEATFQYGKFGSRCVRPVP